MSVPLSPASPITAARAVVMARSLPDNAVPVSPTSSADDLALLARLEEANRMLEADKRSLQSLSVDSIKTKHSSHSRQGSISSVVSNTSISSATSVPQRIEPEDILSPEDLWEIWGKLVTDWDTIVKRKASYIKELVRKGVPHHFRGIVWQLLCSAHDSPVKEQYAEYLKMTSPSEKMIRRDITRTYPDHEFFKEKNGLGQESLFNVMKAYSLHDREVGYCQGSGFIVGLILMQMPEEEAFAVLVRIMQDYRLRELFKPSMAELGLCMFQLECMIQDLLPQLYSHFQMQNFCVSMFASSWFLTLFATTLPLPLTCRIFDIFLSEGMEMVFRVGFALLQMTEDELLSRDMEGMIQFLQKDIAVRVDQDQEALFQTAYNVKYNARKMKKLEKEYNALKSKEQEEQVELRRLRTENRLLRQRIDNLEKETATLADRLIQDQVKYAQQEEEVYVLRREVSVARQQSQETKHKLEEVTTQLEEACNSTASSTSADLEDDVSKDDQIEELRRQLVDARQQMGESHSISRELRDKIRELESINRQMQKDPSSEMQHLQEELIACKLREAEANLSHKELQQKVHDLDRHWKKHIERQSSGGNGKPSKDRIHQLNDDLMAIRIREAEAVADLKEMKLKVMELETQNHICDRQIGRLTTENEKLKDQQEEGVERERGLHSNIRELDRKISDLDSKRKEDQMMAKIKDAEHAQTVAEMRQRIAELEIENQELVTAGQLLERGDRLDLEHKIADLQEEVLQHKMARRLQSLSSLALNNASVESESDYDTDDLEATLRDAQRLTLVSSLTGMDLEAALRSQQRLRLAELDSSEGENGIGDANIGDSSATNNRQKCTRKKKKASSSTSSSLKRATRADVDFDKTPTQDTFNTEMFLIENGTVNNSNGVVAGDAQPVTVDISDTSSSPDAQPDSRSTLNGSDSPSLASTASS